MTEEKEIPFGAFDSETIGWTYTIPKGFTAKIEDGKIIVEKKESGDEKIRKEMIDYFSQFKEDGIRGVDITPWIAYLEKQKEQKPKILIPKFQEGDMVISTKNNRLTYKILEVGHINELGNPDYKVEIFTDGKPDKPRNIKYIEIEKMDSWGEPIEQKPAESDLDAINLSKILAADRLASAEMTGRLKERNEILENPEKYGLHKSTEWSEEEKGILLECISVLQNSSDWLLADRLSSLRPQPHCKPSEYQMRYLEDAMDRNDRCGYVLRSLYDDLKKL